MSCAACTALCPLLSTNNLKSCATCPQSSCTSLPLRIAAALMPKERMLISPRTFCACLRVDQPAGAGSTQRGCPPGQPRAHLLRRAGQLCCHWCHGGRCGLSQRHSASLASPVCVHQQGSACQGCCAGAGCCTILLQPVCTQRPASVIKVCTITAVFKLSNAQLWACACLPMITLRQASMPPVSVASVECVSY